ncbi:pH-sensitive chloride channel 2-like [Artemia franciscana]|uniref:Uncharacterized protein n=1 Tax=Artemia franciscana TaxID=6661 RepID=A0AA88HL23_ARTSF|nr:hypothetical protein QYM36_009672 [Artemia franciscana]
MVLISISAIFVLLNGVKSESATDVVNSPNAFEIFDDLTKSSKYDIREHPLSKGPLRVGVSVSINALGELEPTRTTFTSQLTIREVWTDNRLSYAQIPNHPPVIIGEADLADKIWKPSISIANEMVSSMVTIPMSNKMVEIFPDGKVIYSFRIRSSIFCAVYLMKYPFERQFCNFYLESWLLDDEDLVLEWETEKGLDFVGHYPIKEYYYTGSSISNGTVIRPDGVEYSTLDLEVQFRREYTWYLLDFYFPSILVTMMSWIAFWIDPAGAPGRLNMAVIATFTYVELRRLTATQIPRVGYVKALDMYSVIVVLFLWSTLVQYGFIHSVWNRSGALYVSKLSARQVLKSHIAPSSNRRQSLGSIAVANPVSLESIDENEEEQNNSTFSRNLNSKLQKVMRDQDERRLSAATTSSFPDSTINDNDFASENGDTITREDNRYKRMMIAHANKSRHRAKRLLAQREAVKYIDKKCRILYPTAFLAINIIYFIYCFT